MHLSDNVKQWNILPKVTNEHPVPPNWVWIRRMCKLLIKSRKITVFQCMRNYTYITNHFVGIVASRTSYSDEKRYLFVLILLLFSRVLCSYLEIIHKIWVFSLFSAVPLSMDSHLPRVLCLLQPLWFYIASCNSNTQGVQAQVSLWPCRNPALFRNMFGLLKT